MKEVGTVICKAETPNSHEFSFVINEDKDSVPVRSGQFVMITSPEGELIARVSDIIKTNRYFNHAESVREFERSGENMNDIFPTKRWEYLVGDSKILGIYSSGWKRSTFPVAPGDKVYLAENDLLVKFFGLDEKNGMNLGDIPFHDLKAKINMTKLLQKHLALLSISGGGKSHTASVMIEELLKKQEGRIGTVVIDTHGEYIGFQEDEKFRDRSTVFRGSKIKIGVPTLYPQQILEFIPNLSPVQQREFKRIFRNVKKDYEGRSFDLRNVIYYVREDEKVASGTREVLVTTLSELNNTRFFSYHDNPSLDEIVKPGNASIIDISDLTSLKKRQILVTYLARKLFNARMRGNISPFALFVEEAHNFAPETAKRESALSKSIIQKIAREGRKFHSSLVLISQRPIQLSTTALSQCNTHLIHRVTNPYDLDHIKKSSEGLSSDVIRTIPSLRVGEGLIVGEAVNYPLFVQVRQRESKEDERFISLEEAAKKFEENDSKNKKDAESFM